MTATTGRVPFPVHERRVITESQAWDDQGARDIVGTCVHRMVGTLWGTDTYFRTDALSSALTDFGIGGSLDDGSDGLILMWNDPMSRRSPYANGWESEGPSFDRNGEAFYNYYRSANRNLVSIELSGQPTTPVTTRQVEALCQLMAHYHDAAGTPWDTFPTHPVSKLITSLEHFEFSAKDCPFSIVRNLRPQYLERAREIMKFYQQNNVSTSTSFTGKDRIQVNDGPLNLRTGPSVNHPTNRSLPTGSVLAVRVGPTVVDGRAWYSVVDEASATEGWVAGGFCVLLAAGGASMINPSPVPAVDWGVGTIAQVTDGPLNLRSGAGTGFSSVALLPTGTLGGVVSGPVNADGYSWVLLDTRFGRGWVANAFLTRQNSPTNQVANPKLDRDLTNVVATSGGVLFRVLVGSSYALRVSLPVGPNAGVSFLGTPKASSGSRWYSGSCDLFGGGTIDGVRLSIRYSDGTTVMGQAAPAQLLTGSSWSRLVMPSIASDGNKTVARVDILVSRQAAGPLTLYVDNAQIVEI